MEKGSASNLMTQIIEGAEKNRVKFQKEKGKKEKLLKKLKSQTVHVGPLTWLIVIDASIYNANNIDNISILLQVCK